MDYIYQYGKITITLAAEASPDAECEISQSI
jgi:hypothetical protein